MRASVAGALLLEVLVGALGYQNGLGAFDGLFNDCVALLAVRAPSSAPPANATPLQNAFFNALATAAGLCALLLSGRRFSSLVVVLGAMELVLAAAAALQLGFGLRMGPVAALAGLALCYPWWILYRQEARLRHLGDEFARMAADPQALPRALAPWRTEKSADARMLSLSMAAENLRSLYEVLDTNLQSLPDAVVVTDARGNVTQANRAAASRFGLADADEMNGRRFEPLLREFLSARGATLALPPLEGEHAQRRRFELETALDSGCDLLVKGCPRFAPHGGFAGWTFSIVDIGSVREVQRKREEALAFISHDIRAPQSSILAMIELQRSGLKDAPEASELLPRIELLAQHSLKLAEDFLSMARAESRSDELEPFDLRDVVDEAVDQLWAKAKARQMALHVELPREPCVLAIDRALLIRAVSNLIDNAVKFSPRQTAIHVACESLGDAYRISVRDQGPGIPDGQAGLIFDKFKRLGKSGAGHADGMGLGLAFVAAVAERHGGHVCVESAEGGGATFSIMLPAC